MQNQAVASHEHALVEANRFSSSCSQGITTYAELLYCTVLYLHHLQSHTAGAWRRGIWLRAPPTNNAFVHWEIHMQIFPAKHYEPLQHRQQQRHQHTIGHHKIPSLGHVASHPLQLWGSAEKSFAR